MKPNKTIAATLALFGLLLVPLLGTANAIPSKPSQGFLTSADPYVSLAPGVEGWAKPLLTVGDRLPNGYTFEKIPDGLGILQDGSGAFNLFVNHELSADAKVSKLRLHQGTGAIITGEFMVDGSQDYQRFCSSSLVNGYGFDHPIYFTNEEVDDGIVVAVDTRTGRTMELPWLGKLSHENTILIPHFHDTIGKIVVLTSEDGEPGNSEVYMYIADSADELLAGTGQLYVFGAENPDHYEDWSDIYHSTGRVQGKFIPLHWQSADDASTLHEEAIDAGAFRFIRPEDGAVDKRPGFQNILYMADTGNNRLANGDLIPAGSNGQTWEKGRIYKFVFTDSHDPTKASFEVMFDGNDPTAPAYEIGLSNPDNLDTSMNSLLIQEDRIGVTRSPAGESPYDISRNAKIVRYDLATGELTIVAYVNQLYGEDQAARHGDWESSGIIDASGIFGQGAWLLDVQAHSIDEGGQLLLLHLDSS